MTAIVTAEQLVAGLAARIENGVDANYDGENKRLKDAMVARNFFVATGSISQAGVSSVNGATGAVALKTVNGQSLTGTGDIVVSGGGAAGVSSVNGATGAVALKTVNGQSLTGTGDIVISGGGGGTGLTAGSTGTGYINYNGTTPTSGQWYGGATLPTGTERLTYNGKLVTNTALVKGHLNIVGDSYPGIGIATSETSNSTSKYAIVSWDTVATNRVTIGAVGPSTVTTLIAGGVHGATNPVMDIFPDRVESLADLHAKTKLVLHSTLTAGGSTGTSGQVLTSTGSGVAWTTITGGGTVGVSSVNGATGAVTLKTVNGQALTGSGSITGLTAGSTSAGFINYNGTSATAGQWYGGTTMPTGNTRLNFAGSLVSNLPTANGFIRVVDSTYPGVLLMGSYHENPIQTSPDNGIFNYSVADKMVNIGGYGPGTSVALAAGGGSGGVINVIAKGTASQLDIRVPTLIGYTSSQSSVYKLQVNSQIFATSSTIATSDERYKTNVTELTGALGLVNKLNPVQFDWLKHPVHMFPEGKTVGFIAQEVAEVLKDTDYANSVVKANNCELPDGTTEEFLGIAEGNLIALLTAAVKELTSQVQALTSRVHQLESATP